MSWATDRAAATLREHLHVEYSMEITMAEARVVIERMEDAGVIVLAQSGVVQRPIPLS